MVSLVLFIVVMKHFLDKITGDSEHDGTYHALSSLVTANQVWSEIGDVDGGMYLSFEGFVDDNKYVIEEMF